MIEMDGVSKRQMRKTPANMHIEEIAQYLGKEMEKDDRDFLFSTIPSPDDENNHFTYIKTRCGYDGFWAGIYALIESSRAQVPEDDSAEFANGFIAAMVLIMADAFPTMNPNTIVERYNAFMESRRKEYRKGDDSERGREAE